MPARKRVVNRSRPTPSKAGWLVLRVELVAGNGDPVSPSPGRDLLVCGTHSFADLAAAIDRAFARWDLGHLHEFHLPDGRVIGIAEADEFGDDENEIDDRTMTVGAAGFGAGASFEYVFDLGDAWEHRCTVLRQHVDPIAEWGATPREIVPVFGWGVVPDQYGRTGPDDDQ